MVALEFGTEGVGKDNFSILSVLTLKYGAIVGFRITCVQKGIFSRVHNSLRC